VNQATIENLATLLPISAFLLLLLLQTVAPRRDLVRSGIDRFCHNLFLFVINTLIMRLLVPLTLVAVAAWSQTQQFGLFQIIEAPFWLACVVSVIVLDFAIYWQHVATHKIPLLWRMHKVHHADHDMDVTTSVRFHPLELLLSLVYKALVVGLLGAPITAVIIFELLIFIGPAFNHSNLRLPNWLDSKLRWFIATPDVHRAHHSVHPEEQDTNYGFFLIWWDRLFNTYTAEPKEGHAEMRIGLSDDKDQCERVDQMLMAPFK
jgi:sterol desaturase/sphingolipid hydroxylase (fatty acid hydroxylase superfamily)